MWEAVHRASSFGPASSAYARPSPPATPLNPIPCGLDPSSIHASPARSVLLSYKLLDGEASRPALVFLHGLFGSKTNFNSIAKALAQQTGRRVSFRERRGPAGGGAWLGGAREVAKTGPAFLPSLLDTWRRVAGFSKQKRRRGWPSKDGDRMAHRGPMCTALIPSCLHPSSPSFVL